MARSITRHPFSKERFRYAKQRKKYSHDRIQKESTVDKSTYFMDFRKNYRTTNENLVLVANTLEVAESYLKGTITIPISKTDPLYSYWEGQGRIDPEGNLMPPFGSALAIERMNNRKEALLDYLELLGIRGLNGVAYHFSREQIQAYIDTHGQFEIDLTHYLLSYLIKDNFFGDDVAPTKTERMKKQ